MRSNPSLRDTAIAGLVATFAATGEALAEEETLDAFSKEALHSYVHDELGEDVLETVVGEMQFGRFAELEDASEELNLVIPVPENFSWCDRQNIAGAYATDAWMFVRDRGEGMAYECDFYYHELRDLGRTPDGDIVVQFVGGQIFGMQNSCRVITDYSRVLTHGGEKYYAVIADFSTKDASGRLLGQVDCEDVSALVAKPEPVVEPEPVIDPQPEPEPIEFVGPPAPEKERNPRGVRASADAGYMRESVDAPVYQGAAMGLGVDYDFGRLRAGVDGNLMFTGRDGVQSTHFDRAGGHLGVEIGGERLAFVPELGGGMTHDFGVLGWTWYADAGTDIVVAPKALRDRDLALVGSARVGFDRDLAGTDFPIKWDMERAWVRGGIGVQWSYDVKSSGRDTGNAEVVSEPVADEAVEMFGEMPVLQDVEYFDAADRFEFPDYVNNEYDGSSQPKLTQAENEDLGEFIAVFEEMPRHASRNIWKSVESKYQRIQGIDMDLLWTHVHPSSLSKYYFLGALAARNRGDVMETYSRLQLAAKTDPENKEILDWIADIEANYFGVQFSGLDLTPSANPFASEKRSAIDFARETVSEERKFEGLLPRDISVTHYVVTGMDNKWYALLPPEARAETGE